VDRRQALIDKFRQLAGERVARIRDALGGDGEVVERELHTLKGEAQLLGFGDIAQVARALEQLVGTEIDDRVEEGLSLIERLRMAPADDDTGAAAASEFVRAVDSS
jgi:two-component system chemotaxis sensor kinase CheA/two-component system sensor histidine kinase and response regulator WspE